MKSRKAFTLVELLVVITIAGILLALLVPVIFAVINGKSKEPSITHMPVAPVSRSVIDSPKSGEAIPITIHGMKYTIIYNGPDDVEIYRQKECEDATNSSTNRKAVEK
ncbi:MAG: type II secretion system GspH family protein [Proteobacteria bacterium]|jgi:prepilin-type N-terminal cleavage/methylation domain-containing protein|nr:type II secretion system GspH family protein [Pseudomonadota bacterium]